MEGVVTYIGIGALTCIALVALICLGEEIVKKEAKEGIEG